MDWLNSFFDEPSHDTCNINALNPPISKLSDTPLSISAACPSMVKVLSQMGDDISCLETSHLSANDFANDIVLKSPSKATCPDPFLGAADAMSQRSTQGKQVAEMAAPQILKRGQSFRVLTQLDKNTLNLATARELIQRLKSETQLQNTAHRVPDQKLDNRTLLQRNIKRSFEQMIKTESEATDNDSGKLDFVFALSFFCFIHSKTGCTHS